MVEINITRGCGSFLREEKIINPINLSIQMPAKSEGRSTTELGGKEYLVESANEVVTFKSSGDQRIWNCWWDKDAEKLNISQHRVLGYREIRDLFNDTIELKPISLGLQYESLEAYPDSCSILLDVDLRLCYSIDFPSGYRLSVPEWSCDDLLEVIKENINKPNLTIDDFPKDIFNFSDTESISTIKALEKKRSNER